MKIATSPFVYWGVAVFMPEKLGNFQHITMWLWQNICHKIFAMPQGAFYQSTQIMNLDVIPPEMRRTMPRLDCI